MTPRNVQEDADQDRGATVGSLVVLAAKCALAAYLAAGVLPAWWRAIVG